MKRKLVAVQIALLAILMGCGYLQAPAPQKRQPPTLRGLVKEVTGPSGYVARGAPAFFNRDNLYKAINGMAPEFISYGCVGLGMREWKKPGETEDAVQAEIYDMGSPLGAYGIYSRAHVGEGDFIDIGEEAAVAEDLVEFSRDRFYVRLLGPVGARPTLERMARSIISRVPAGPPPERLMEVLPREGRIARTARWMPEGAFGMDFLTDVWIARYRVGGEEFELYLAPFNSERAVSEALGKFREAVGKHSPQPVDGAFPGFTYADEWIGRVWVFEVGRYMAVVVGCEKRVAAEQLLRQISA